jgi:uncharacterized membrane-anchored protein YitT (DUF2179 family)
MGQVKKTVINELKGYLFMLLGCIAYGVSTSLFFVPNSIVAGGVTGLSVIVNFLYDKISVGMIFIIINLPILLFAFKFLGWKFIYRCLLTIVTLGVVTDVIALLPKVTDDVLLSSLYGGVCQGIGIGLFVKYEFSSGGTELLGRLICRFVKVLKIPLAVGILDGMIVILGAIVTRNPDNMLYALIVIFVSTKVSEIVLVGLEKSKLCIIITDKGDEMSDLLIHNSPRGVTMLNGQGMYTHKEHNVLLTCVKNRQLTQLKQLVKSVDPRAFIIINESVEVRGQGFQALDETKSSVIKEKIAVEVEAAVTEYNENKEEKQ